MAMEFFGLDDSTRASMAQEFEAELSGPKPYFSPNLSRAGLEAFPSLMRAAIESGNEVTLARALGRPTFWNSTEQYVRRGSPCERRINPQHSAERLALTEFNTWFVHGYARRLMGEGEKECRIYRASTPKWEESECSSHEGAIVPIRLVYEGHRARYWPVQNSEAFSVPFGPSCHHTIGRL